MSLSKPADQPQLREPKCSRCRHHGLVVRLKGHMKSCPFVKCDCWKCHLITQRTRITTIHRGLSRAQSKEQRPCDLSGAVTPTPGSFPDGGACQSASLKLIKGPSARGEDAAWEPGRRPAWARNSGVSPLASSEEGWHTPLNAPNHTGFFQTAPLPVIHYPFRMPGHCSSSYTPDPDFMLNRPRLPHVPAGLYSNDLCGPAVVPHFHSSPLHYPPPQQPGPAGGRQVFIILQPSSLTVPLQEASSAMQHPQAPPPNSEDIIELD